MSRFTLLLLGSALILIVAACDTNGDDDVVDNGTDDTPATPADNGLDDQDDVLTEEDDQATTEDAEVGDDPDADAVPTDDEDEVTDPDAEVNGEDDEVAFDDEEVAEPEDDAVDPDEMEPADPNQGMFFDLSVEEANEMTQFEVVEPEYVPEALELQTIMGMASMEATEEEMGEEAATITFAYQQPPEGEDEMGQGLPVEFMQSLEIDMSEGLGPDVETEEVGIGDREVTRISMMAETGDEILAWVWQENDVYFSVAAILGAEVDESEIEQMIESIPAA